MFGIFNALGGVLTTVVTVVLGLVADVPVPAKTEVAYVSFTPASFWAEKCVFTGILTPYVRDWEEVVDNGYTKEIIPPDLETVKGLAVVLTQKTCPGKLPEKIALVGELHRASWVRTVVASSRINAMDLVSLSKDIHPKWLSQVSDRVEARAAAGDVKAKEFLDSLSVTQVAVQGPTP